MDVDPRKHFETVIHHARIHLSQVRVIQNDVTASRAILEIHAQYRGMQVRLKEIRVGLANSYSYYLLKDGKVVIGFDNHPDVRAIKAKFGREYRKHLGKLIPHQHGWDKQTIELTAEMDAKEFLNRLEIYVKPE